METDRGLGGAVRTSPALEKLRNTAVFYPAFRSLWEALTLGEEADVRRLRAGAGSPGLSG